MSIIVWVVLVFAGMSLVSFACAFSVLAYQKWKEKREGAKYADRFERGSKWE